MTTPYQLFCTACGVEVEGTGRNHTADPLYDAAVSLSVSAPAVVRLPVVHQGSEARELLVQRPSRRLRAQGVTGVCVCVG